MKLWLIEQRPQYAMRGPWSPPWEKCLGFIVRAETEERAREIATNSPAAGGEVEAQSDVWLSDRWSTCVELFANGDEVVIMTDYHNG